jgi:hypothetical protein
MSRVRDLASILTASSVLGTDVEVATAVSDHSAASDPHTGYVLESLIDAKGDLIVGSADNTVAKLTTGNNGEQIVADSSTSTGLRYQGSITAGKNFAINGGFDIWQRGTSFANPASYFADRWTTGGPSAGVNNMTLSRETTGVPAGSQYLLRLTSTGSSSYSSVNQFMETANVVPLQGKTVTYSFKVRRNSTYSNSGILVIVNGSSAVDAGTGGTYSTNLAYVSIPLASIPTTAATSTATYYNASVTFNVPNDGTCNSLYMQLAYNGGVANGSILEYAQCQLELGSVPTTFSRAGGTIQGELGACQRYYSKSYNLSVAPGTSATEGAVGFSTGVNTTSSLTPTVMVNLKQTMRTAPTVTLYDMTTNSGKVTQVAADLSYTDNQAGTADRIGESQFRIYSTMNGRAGFYAQYTASAEL